MLSRAGFCFDPGAMKSSARGWAGHGPADAQGLSVRFAASVVLQKRNNKDRLGVCMAVIVTECQAKANHGAEALLCLLKTINLVLYRRIDVLTGHSESLEKRQHCGR